ncbi:major facilitator superfamily domain-containing protein 6-B isoform X3 [Parasteatoda tepidariorum]|uniref:major facilitator superfamily domain-containing protein 6-B isoform X3 n=1 Tax=Parasteatoda tepidariorum TaxID=114398 RepID=UPI0039BD677E
MEETNREKMVSENSAVHKIPTKHSFPKIDKEMIRFKGHFFFFYGVAGTMTPYLPLIARKRLKLTATSLATILTAQDPWLVLPVEILHGLTSGIFYPVVANYGKLSARPGTEATTQSIIFSTHEGLGAGIGCILTGISFDNIGGHWTFFYLSLCAFCSAALNILIHLTIKRRSKILQITVQ